MSDMYYYSLVYPLSPIKHTHFHILIRQAGEERGKGMGGNRGGEGEQSKLWRNVKLEGLKVQ